MRRSSEPPVEELLHGEPAGRPGRTALPLDRSCCTGCSASRRVRARRTRYLPPPGCTAAHHGLLRRAGSLTLWPEPLPQGRRAIAPSAVSLSWAAAARYRVPPAFSRQSC